MFMEMTYNAALVMPNNFEVVNNDEMTYVNGGWCIETHWWGYNLYLTHSERRTLSTGQIIAGIALGCAELWVPAGIVTGVCALIANYDDGNGVRIRMTGLYSNAVVTGLYALSASQERNIASKNRII